MKTSLTTHTRRGNGQLLLMALFLTKGPSFSHARNLRLGNSISTGSFSYSYIKGESPANEKLYLKDEGFEVVGGAIYHEPTANVENITWRRSMMQEEEADEEEGEYFEPKEYIDNETLSFVDPNDAEHNRIQKSCGSQEKLWVFTLRTDNYGYETSWKLEKRLANNAWSRVTFGPPNNRKYHDNTIFRGAMCLRGATMYKLTVMDARKDGICCGYGRGTYSYSINGIKEYDSLQRKTFSKQATHSFYVGLPVANNGNHIFQGKSSACGQNKQKIGIKFVGDNYAKENSWELRSLATNQVIRQKAVGSYRPNQSDMTEVCVPAGKYRFTLKDGVGDGICCGDQGNGRYEISVDDERIIYGSDFTHSKEVTHVINIGYHTKLNQMSKREAQYLDCHNWRRKKYHEKYGKTYVPLKYDLSLADDAQYWANELLKECHLNGIRHQPGEEQGENMAKNVGTPGSEFGKLYPVENICRRWFEREEHWGYPENAHFTQGLWRSAKYVGCAESTKAMQDGKQCHIQVCRYARAGNCDMGRYKSTTGENWKVPMLQDHNPCGPICPPEGCH